MRDQTNDVLDLADLRRAKDRRSRQRLARQLLLAAIHMETPSMRRRSRPIGAFVLRRATGDLVMVADPLLEEVELKLAAWGLALTRGGEGRICEGALELADP